MRAIKGSPAAAADLQPGDMITVIDDQPTAGRQFGALVMQLRGKPGTPVMLEIQRDGETLIRTLHRKHMARLPDSSEYE